MRPVQSFSCLPKPLIQIAHERASPSIVEVDHALKCKRSGIVNDEASLQPPVDNLPL